MMGKNNKNARRKKKGGRGKALAKDGVGSDRETSNAATPTNSAAALSLSSKLKRERGTAAATPLPPAWKWDEDKVGSGGSCPKKTVLTPSDGEIFDKCLRRCYRGLSWEHPDSLPSSLHRSFTTAFDDLNEAGLFLYDCLLYTSPSPRD